MKRTLVLATFILAGCDDDDAVSPDSGVDAVADQTPQQDTTQPEQLEDKGVPDRPSHDSVTVDHSIDQLIDQLTDLRPDAVPTDAPPPDAAPDFAGDVAPDGPPPVGNCSGAQQLQLVNGVTTVSGDTTNLTDDFGGVVCQGSHADSPTGQLSRGQAYYKLAATAGQWYAATLVPDFPSAHLYIFTSTECTRAAIEADCQSKGATGEASGLIPWGKTRSTYFQASSDQDLYIAVDSSAFVGAYDLLVEQISAPSNGTCTSAAPLTLGVAAKGHTGPKLTPNDLTTVSCGSGKLFAGPQAYYSFPAVAATTYRLRLTADSTDWAYLYLFSETSCSADAINSDCGSGGATGDLSAYVLSGATGELLWTAPADGVITVAVDHASPEDFGGFTLLVEAI